MRVLSVISSELFTISDRILGDLAQIRAAQLLEFTLVDIPRARRAADAIALLIRVFQVFALKTV